MSTATAALPSASFGGTQMTLANYKLAGAAFVAALAAVGLVQTSDTGQVNYSTVGSVPNNPGTDYTIWRFNDALAASYPVIIKFRTFGSNSTSSTGETSDKGFTFDVQFCTRTDGAGTAVGNFTGTYIMIQGNSVANAITPTIYFSGDGSYLTLIYDPTTSGNTAAHRGGFAVERLKDSNGSDLSTGFAIAFDGRSTGRLSQVVFSEYYGTIYPSAGSQWTTNMPNSGSASFGGNIGVFPVFPNLGYPSNPMKTCIAVFAVDVPVGGSTFSASLYGVSRNYMVTNGGFGLQTAGLNGNATVASSCFLYQ